ncbi:hypothetical protein SprV_0602097000 [Sparganum proliferum]
MWKLVFSLLVVVGILEQVNPAKMADPVVNQDKASSGDGVQSVKPKGPENEVHPPPPPPAKNETGATGNGAQNLWLSGGHAVAPLLVLALCLH